MYTWWVRFISVLPSRYITSSFFLFLFFFLTTFAVGECETHQVFFHRVRRLREITCWRREWMSVSHAELSCISEMGRVEKHAPWEDPPPPLPLKSSTFCFGLSLFLRRKQMWFTGAWLNRWGFKPMISVCYRKWRCKSARPNKHQGFGLPTVWDNHHFVLHALTWLLCLCVVCALEWPQCVFITLVTQNVFASGGFESKWKAERRKKNWVSKKHFIRNFPPRSQIVNQPRHV